MDAMLFYAGADVAIINSGLIVQPFEKDFSRKNLHESLPHQMRLAKLTVSSQELLEIYETIYQQGHFSATKDSWYGLSWQVLWRSFTFGI